ncbi:hypothetical protein ACS0TY_022206 [Phlomoides rotata]
MLPFLSLAAPLTSRVAAALCTLPLCCRRLLNPLRAHMFTNDQRQKERTGKSGTLRLQYLQELVAQFQNASSEEIKEKIVANLGNFAYDPYNYTFFRQLNVLELFLDCLTKPNEKLVEFAVGEICNACANPTNAVVIIQCDGLLSSNAYQVNYALGSLYYFCNATTEDEILKPEIVEAIERFTAAGSVNMGFSNLAHAFLDRHVHKLT